MCIAVHTASVEILILEVPDALDLPGLLVDTKRLELDFRTFIISLLQLQYMYTIVSYGAESGNDQSQLECNQDHIDASESMPSPNWLPSALCPGT